MSSSSIRRATVAPAHISIVRDVRYHSVALLTVLVWNALLTFGDEVRYIWPMHNKKPFKWVYFILRYAVLVAHTAHNFLIEPLANGSNPKVLCNLWYAYVVAFPTVLETLLELILASRIYALYNGSRRIAFLITILMLSEVGAAVRMLCPWSSSDFFKTCLLILPPKGAGVQTFLMFLVHCTFIGLILFKYLFTLRTGYARSPLVSLVIRDSTTVYVAMVSLLVVSAIIIYGLDSGRGVAVPLWMTAMMSIMGCHLILRMERLARDMSMNFNASQLIFTSKISLAALGSAGRQGDLPS